MDTPIGDTPPLLRPIPRRPFDLSLTSPTPPEEDYPSTPFHGASHPVNSHAATARLLDAQQQQQDADSLSRAASFMNLTTSTLFGIYAPTVSSPGRAGLDDSSPWGAGAETPARRPALDDDTYALMRDRSHGSPAPPLRRHRRRSPAAGESRGALAASLAVRAALLFALGVGYGALVSQLRGGAAGRSDPRLLVFWGVAGVALGGLLPWFDGLWEDGLARREEAGRLLAAVKSGGKAVASPETDWTLVVRGIGAFVGIVFAIRKLSWTSTMQASLTLAMTNPFLWYLIDRSKPGFVLSAAVGLAGSAVLMGFNPDVMPAPTQFITSRGTAHLFSNATTASAGRHVPGLTAQETIETGIWMISVLFCSCVCFGNIGRRLALDKSAAGRGRWGGMR